MNGDLRNQIQQLENELKNERRINSSVQEEKTNLFLQSKQIEFEAVTKKLKDSLSNISIRKESNLKRKSNFRRKDHQLIEINRQRKEFNSIVAEKEREIFLLQSKLEKDDSISKPKNNLDLGTN